MATAVEAVVVLLSLGGDNESLPDEDDEENRNGERDEGAGGSVAAAAPLPLAAEVRVSLMEGGGSDERVMLLPL